MKQNRPYFLWDYDLSEDDARRILTGPDYSTKLWLTARILEAARFEDVWKYLKLKDIVAVFPELKLRAPIRQAWRRALLVWNKLKE